MTRRILCLTLTFLCLLSAADAGAQKRKAAARPAAKAKAATVNFSNCGDIWSIADDDKNIYVVIAWSKNMAVIDKATGAMSKVTAAEGEINGPLTLHTPLKTGITQYGTEINLSSCDLILPDGRGNIIAASIYDNLMVIYNATGLKGYSTLAGKPTVFKWE